LQNQGATGDDGEQPSDEDSTFEDFIDLHEIDWIIVFAYFDETGMHSEAPDTVVAGYLFSKNDAKTFRQFYKEKLFPLLPVNKHGKRIFHANKCCPDYGNGEYESLTRETRGHIADLVAEAIIQTVSLGCVVGMEKQEYAKAIAHSPQLANLSGSEYTACLIRCIENMAAWMNTENVKGRILYVFEAGCEHQEEASQFLMKISRSEELKMRYRWHNYTFLDKDENVPQLFAPDLLAWEWQRIMRNRLNPNRKESRPRLSRLLTSKPHIKEYISETGLGIRAIVNTFYGVSEAKKPLEISNSVFMLKDFPNDK
jgi:hypothetical protein